MFLLFLEIAELAAFFSLAVKRAPRRKAVGFGEAMTSHYRWPTHTRAHSKLFFSLFADQLIILFSIIVNELCFVKKKKIIEKDSLCKQIFGDKSPKMAALPSG